VYIDIEYGIVRQFNFTLEPWKKPKTSKTLKLFHAMIMRKLAMQFGNTYNGLTW
jgi:hypothetical protein